MIVTRSIKSDEEKIEKKRSSYPRTKWSRRFVPLAYCRILILATIHRCSTQLNCDSITRTTYQTPPRSYLSLGLNRASISNQLLFSRKKRGKKKRSQTNLYSHGRSAISFLFSLPLPPLPLDLRAFYSTFPIPDDEREKESNWNARQIRIIRYWLIPSASIAVAINVKHQTKPLFHQPNFSNESTFKTMSFDFFYLSRISFVFVSRFPRFDVDRRWISSNRRHNLNRPTDKIEKLDN